ncbi:hypothetical protein ACI68E_001598 [Malassezia pachydermatis]|uniref:Nadp-dependent l-serine l-allo-threonine dehydrogenase n=1 Tax=Malassezia pachydermatis TaxID=77020 RepID=A0A0N0RSN4_9BASI|nr:nadp-dependent l-serine l-allo-threonine dehydrogenase [Malassezia pachydermatis]KOS16145.1 nadp-dependent l-serine l-allo-threonine dehydrogenase [Malassezia pachydermatis]
MQLWTISSALSTAILGYVLYQVWEKREKRSAILPPSHERIVILGASSVDGIGIAIARECLKRGSYNIMLVARRSEALREVKRVLIEEQATRSGRERADQIELFVADCTNADDVYRLQRSITEDFGGVDTLYIVFGAIWTSPLLSVAGVDPCQDPHASSPSPTGLRAIADGVQQSCDANVKGTAMVLAALLPSMQTNSKAPHVAVVGSLASLVPAPTRTVYCATKVAQQMLVESVATECTTQAKVPGRALVKFVVLAPTTVATSFRSRMSVGVNEKSKPTDPQRGRALTTQEVAEEAIYCLEHSITGVRPMPHYYFWVWLLGPLIRGPLEIGAHRRYGY